MSPFAALALGIISEIIGTTSLKLSVGFTKPIPSVFVLLGYSIAFYLFSLALKEIPLGTAYAIWSSIGTIGTVILGVIIWKAPLHPLGILGIAFIIAGVILLNVFGEGARAV